MLKKIPSFWLFFIWLTVTNLVTLALLSVGVYSSTRTQVEEEQQRQLAARVAAQAEAIDARLREFETATVLAASAAQPIVRGEFPLTAEEQAAVLAEYERDGRNVLGRDSWYYTVHRPAFNNDQISNVYLNSNVPLDERMAYLVAASHSLDTLFRDIVARGINTQWVYLTTAEGMMRLYPWHDNNYNNNDPFWEPQTQIFYTEVIAENTPAGQGAWTFPYVDCAGAGLMVTNAVPILAENGRDLLAVMSHDFLIESLQTEVLGFQVGDNGFAFLLDEDAHVIAHRNHPLDTNLPCGEEINVTWAEQEVEVAAVQEQLLGGSAGLTSYTDAEGEMWLVAYDAVETTGWRLGMAIPQSEVIAPATAIFRQVLVAAGVLLLLSLPVSFVAAGYVAQPVRQLSQAAQAIETSIARDEEVKALSTADLAHISGTVELNQLVAVFGQMVNALQERVKELDSLYAIGQTMTGNLDYESAMSSVLAAVRQVVEYDAAEITIAEGEYLRVYAWRGQQGMRDTTGHKYRIGRGLTGRIAQTKQAIYEARVGEEAAADSNLTLVPGGSAAEQTAKQKLMIRSFLGIPLLIGDRLVGVIALVHHEADYFTQTDQRQLNKLAAQASIAIDNALRVRARESELREQIRTLQVRIEDVNRARNETGLDAALLQDLRAQARALRLRRGSGEE